MNMNWPIPNVVFLTNVLQNISKEEPFPAWLVDLMVNIEEAKTHQLVVE